MCKLYNPVIEMTSGDTTTTPEEPKYVVWSGRLSDLFAEWEQGGFSCLDSTGDTKLYVRNHLRTYGKYRMYGGVGTYFDIAVVNFNEGI